MSDLVNWKQTFRNTDGKVMASAGVSVYLAGTSSPARIFNSNSQLHFVAPQVYTDNKGLVSLNIDPDDYSSGQLFDVICMPDGKCTSCNDVKLPSLMLLQDTEGSRNFKNIFAQDEPPTEGMRKDDLWFDTDNLNHVHVYDGTNWISMQDGSIAVAGTTADWSEIINDNGGKPVDNADITGDNTSDNTDHVNDATTQSSYYFDVYGDLRMRDGADILFYDSSGSYKGSFYAPQPTGPQFIGVSTHFAPSLNNSYRLGTTYNRWMSICVADAGVNIGANQDMMLQNTGTWNSIGISNNNFVVWDNDNSKSMIQAYKGAGVSLWYDGVKKLETSNTGITVYGSCNGCDYVFDKEYNLISLDELKEYVSKYNHLPNMTINQGTQIDLNKLRQETVEKIEELSIYILQLHDRIKTLEDA